MSLTGCGLIYELKLNSNRVEIENFGKIKISISLILLSRKNYRCWSYLVFIVFISMRFEIEFTCLPEMVMILSH